MATSSVPSVWEGHGKRIFFLPYHYSAVYGPERLWDDQWTHKFFLDYWSYSIWIAIFYCFVVHIIERWMRERKAWHLNRPLVIWNATLALFSLFGTIRMGEEFRYALWSRPLLDSISYSVDPKGPAAFWAFMFAVSKIVELGDTAFVVLRKKSLIFLHWYHHAVVLIYVWHSAAELVAGGRWFIFMNYAVHTLMYTYYAMSAAGVRLPRSLSMFITTAQTSQMLIGVSISFVVLYMKLSGKVLQQSYENLAICFAIYASFAALFIKFFHKSYLAKRGDIRKTKKAE